MNIIIGFDSLNKASINEEFSLIQLIHVFIIIHKKQQCLYHLMCLLKNIINFYCFFIWRNG